MDFIDSTEVKASADLKNIKLDAESVSTSQITEITYQFQQSTTNLNQL